ncbi:Ger(x)C family spore germination protein [Paenibacillus brevis]|uniref:Ger(X)C family spore germination protein n=1 Tax=Paenibacillus brevis TaxID=2841508 RepID=A0ABS6FQD6_9BACL|nr:Ger(x)C family spore germination protein [Paenibacillus brevis]MBU5672442.1 Ger(x)C family spore germination protein [Paenibacillus brevis]
MSFLNKQRRFLAIALLILLLFTGVGGCWSSMELNTRAFIQSVLIDRTEDGQIQLYVGVPLPNRMVPGQAGGSSPQATDPFTFVGKKAENISQALRLIQVDISRSISFGQTRVIVVGRRMAEHGIDEVIEFVNRQPAFRLSANLYVTTNEVEEIMKIPLVFERFLSDILKRYVSTHVTLDTTVKDFKLAKYKGGDILTPLLVFGKASEISTEDPKKSMWMGSGGAAIFSGGKMSKITMNRKELQGALWISSQMKSSIITINSPSDGREISCTTEGISTSIKPIVKNGQISFKIKSKAKAHVLSSMSEIDLKDPEIILKIEKILDKSTEERLRLVIDKTRQAQSDSFLMSQYLDWRYPKAWHSIKDRWKSYYATELPIEIDVSIRLNRTGGVYRSVKQETEKIL